MIKHWKWVLVLAGTPFIPGGFGGPRVSDISARESISLAAPNTVPADSNTQADASPVTSPLPVDDAAPPARPELKLSAGAAEIVKLAQAGVDGEVMLAYIGTVKSCFNLASDQIVYLNDLGVSGSVVKAMIQRDGAIIADSLAAQAATANSLPTTPDANPPSPPVPDAPAFPAPPGDLVADGSTGFPDYPGFVPGDYSTAEDGDYFYDSLAPYGSWVYLSGYGVCWQPTVGLGNHGWRPYCDRGRWFFTDCGWYWHSDYSWGWAPFHYGRWFRDEHRGWVWAPDRTWGPAWVAWRHSAEHVAWAPLPPSARFTPDVGFAPGNQAGAASEFGLQRAAFTFIPRQRLSDPAPYRYALSLAQRNAAYNQSMAIGGITVEHKQVVNHGLDPREVTALSGIEVRRAEVRELPSHGGSVARADRFTKSGNTLVVFRFPPASAPRIAVTVRVKQKPALPAPRPLPIMNLKSDVSSPTATDPPAAGRETYPPGSLVLNGNNNGEVVPPLAPLPNMKLAHRPMTQAMTEQTSRPVPTDLQADYSGSRTVTPTGELLSGAPAYQRPVADFQAGTPGWRQPGRPYRQSDPLQSPQVIVIPSRYTAAQALANHPAYNRAPDQTPGQFQTAPADAPAPAGRPVAIEQRPVVVEHSAPEPVSRPAAAHSGSASSTVKK